MWLSIMAVPSVARAQRSQNPSLHDCAIERFMACVACRDRLPRTRLKDAQRQQPGPGRPWLSRAAAVLKPSASNQGICLCWLGCG
jgi:hypothetical protein